MSAAKNKKRYPKVGERVDIRYGTDPSGKWFWMTDWNALGIHGPFATEREAQKHSQLTILGPNCEVKPGGRWDPAWNRAQ